MTERDKVSATDMDPKGPKGVGESTTRRGEDVADQEGREFEDAGTQGPSKRPVGTTDPDKDGAAPSKPIDKDMPDVQRT